MSALFILLLSWLLPCGAQFIDQIQLYERECLGENKFPCMAGGCIPMDKYCDGNFDCPDGSDESFCHFSSNHTFEPKLCNQSHHFLCKDGKLCLPNSWICNNNTECYDGSDEVNCTSLVEIKNNTDCKGFVCDGNKCISRLWICDGVYDCLDKSDEYSQDQCRHSLLAHAAFDGISCAELGFRKYKHRCIDSSFCLPTELMCNGLVDCRDGSDEGQFCEKFNTFCDGDPCKGNKTRCYPDRNGPVCVCANSTTMEYNFTTNTCQDVDECAVAMPQCSQACHNDENRYHCSCEKGYIEDRFGYLCYALGPEGLLFYSTKNEIGYVTVKTKTRVTVATGMKQAHGVTYDGKYLYWVETADGHQAIFRAELENVQETKQVIVSLGLEEPGDIALDWIGGHIYFSDSERGMIAVCRTDGSVCTILPAYTRNPKFVTLDVKNGTMFWADWHHRPVIMTAHMDGAHSQLLVDNLQGFATGLAIDASNNRLYYVDHTIKVIKLDDRQIYSLFDAPFHHPYAIAVFENTVFWSDWTSHSIQTIDKIHGSVFKRKQLVAFDTSVFDMHIYHPVIFMVESNPCTNNNCSHMCLITSNTTYTCACPNGMKLNKTVCYNMENYRPLSLIVGSGSILTRVEYDTLGSAETHTTHFDIGWVQAMAYDSLRDVLYLYDGQRKVISNIDMVDFSLGITKPYHYKGLVNVIEMDYDYVTDNLYILDAGMRFVEVISLRTGKLVLLYRFKEHETPISFCVLPEYGKMLVVVRENEGDKGIHIDSIGLDGSGREHTVMNDLKGPRVLVRYAHNTDTVYISDDGNSIIDTMNPEGVGRETFREITTSISTLAVTDAYVFWTDRRTPRFFWAPIHDVAATTRRLPLSIYPNNTQLHIQATFPHLSNTSRLNTHPCLIGRPCSDVCVQTPHPHPHTVPANFYLGYKCFCPPGLLMNNGTCNQLVVCKEKEIYCHKSNVCILEGKLCDGKKDCALGEDEEGCDDNSTQRLCPPEKILCNKKCIDMNEPCKQSGLSPPIASKCLDNQFQCYNSSICVERSQVCDQEPDCPNSSDEDATMCDILSCQENEFMCTSGSCILKSFMCDGEQDCTDGSDEANCSKKTCAFGYYQCRNLQCIEMSKRCDGHNDCYDFSDEEQCEESVTMPGETLTPHCAENEYTCELNRSICLPFTARCNFKTECPGGTDETGCDTRCAPHGLFQCRQELGCLSMKRVCNGAMECLDGSDETPDACRIVNKTSTIFPPPLYPASECHNGYLCKNGQCIEWVRLCDQEPNCLDGSDEGGRCLTACNNHTCSFSCQPTPSGPRCMCPRGFNTNLDGQSCTDIDECADDVCTQRCINYPGSFLCSCYHGYALRADRRSCKVVKGRKVSILYVSSNSVRSVSQEGASTVVYNKTNGKIVDIDVNIRKNLLYITYPEVNTLVEVNKDTNYIAVNNIGTPTKVSVDWLTGNVYFVDKNVTNSYIRVCNLALKKCAKLQKLPLGRRSNVTSFIVDPANSRMFYCITSDKESVIWSASLAGHNMIDLTTVRNCTGLAVDSFRKRLYVAETYPASITRMDFEGDKHKKVIFGQPELQEPNGLELFEDSIFFLDANSSKLSRCQLLGIEKQCEPFVYRMFDANTFVIRHESVQRDDMKNPCDGYVCSNVCALDANGAVCLCNDGSVSKNGMCPNTDSTEMPLFSASQGQNSHSSSVKVTIVTLSVVLALVCLFLYGFYHFVHRTRKNRQSTYMEVRFQNTEPSSASVSTEPSPVNEMPGYSGSSTDTSTRHEFVNPIQSVNPLQFVRNVFRHSILQRKKFNNTDTEESEEAKVEAVTSDTESDLDERDDKCIVDT